LERGLAEQVRCLRDAIVEKGADAGKSTLTTFTRWILQSQIRL